MIISMHQIAPIGCPQQPSALTFCVSSNGTLLFVHCSSRPCLKSAISTCLSSPAPHRLNFTSSSNSCITRQFERHASCHWQPMHINLCRNRMATSGLALPCKHRQHHCCLLVVAATSSAPARTSNGVAGSYRGPRAPADVAAELQHAAGMQEGRPMVEEEQAWGEANAADALIGSFSLQDIEKIALSLETKHMFDVSEAALRNIRLLLQLGAKRGQVLRVVLAQPILLEEDFHEQVQEMVELLLGFSVPPVAVVKALGKSVDWLMVPREQAVAVLEFLDKELGVNNLAKVLASSPHVMCQPLGELQATVEYLKGVRVWDVGAALERNPALFGWGRGDVSKKVEMLRSIAHRGGENGEERVEDVRMLVERNVGVMAGTAESAMAAYSVMVQTLGERGARLVVSSRPHILAMPPDSLQEPLAELVALFGADVAASVVAVNANLARRKWEKTVQKVQFLTGEMGRSKEQVGAWPTVLSYNLQVRIVRRYEALKGAGKGSQESLRAMFGCSDEVFERRFGVTLPARQRGKRGRKPKLQSKTLEDV